MTQSGSENRDFDLLSMQDIARKRIITARNNGARVIVRDHVSFKKELWDMVGLSSKNFPIVGYMAGAKITGIGFDYVPAAYTQKLAKQNLKHALNMVFANGGGNPDKGVLKDMGFMSQWLYGLKQAKHEGLCLLTESLVIKEDIPASEIWKILCLRLPDEETRIGTRCDVLLAIGNAAVVFPGDYGSKHEASQLQVRTSINQAFQKYVTIICNPLVPSKFTSGPVGYYDFLLLQDLLALEYEGVRPAALQAMNNSLIVYEPGSKNQHQITQDLVSLTHAVRLEMGECLTGEFDRKVVKSLIQPLSQGSSIRHAYPSMESAGNFVERVAAQVETEPAVPDRVMCFTLGSSIPA